jgi:DNA-binding helix-hairpin-helix protein with protein kinase domain
MQSLGKGKVLRSDLGDVVVGELLGSGGQGDVYRAHLSSTDYALKWYHTHATSGMADQRAALAELARTTPPSSRFLWPVATVEDRVTGGFGYLMPLRPARFAEISQVVSGLARPASSHGPFRTLALFSLRMIEAFRRLHMSGRVYKDLNLGGPFIDLATGEVLICDCDNVRPNKTKGTVFFPEFAAPEVVTEKTHPTAKTDEHSVASLLFHVWVRGNPLDGRRGAEINVFTDGAKRLLFGDEPLFVFDPNDTRNRPVKGLHDAMLANWPRMPEHLQAIFTQAFTVGLRDPEQRPSLKAWLDALRKLHDSLVSCPSCGRETIHDPASLAARRPHHCTWCKKPLPAPVRLTLPSGDVFLSPHMVLLGDHVGARWDVDSLFAETAVNPRDPQQWGIKNLSSVEWVGDLPGGQRVPVPPGRSAVPIAGTTLHFGPPGPGTVSGKVTL